MIRGNINYGQVRDNLRKVIGDLNITSRQLALMAGIDASNFNKKLKGELKITQSDFAKLSRIHINTQYLLSGKGNMYTGRVQKCSEQEELVPEETFQPGIPIYDIDFKSGTLTDDTNEVTPISYADMPGTSTATFWCKTSGYSMSPLINNGDYVCLREIEDWQAFFTYGEVYAIEAINGECDVKRIEKGYKEGILNLVSENPSYKPQPIKIDSIQSLYKIVAVTKML